MTNEEFQVLLAVREYLVGQWSALPQYSVERDRLWGCLQSLDPSIDEYRLNDVRERLHEIELTNDESRRLEWRRLKTLENYYSNRVETHRVRESK